MVVLTVTLFLYHLAELISIFFPWSLCLCVRSSWCLLLVSWCEILLGFSLCLLLVSLCELFLLQSPFGEFGGK